MCGQGSSGGLCALSCFDPHAVAALGLPKSSGRCEAPKPSVEVVATPERSESGVTPQPTKDMPKPAEGTPRYNNSLWV